jgi:hypothetical protein
MAEVDYLRLPLTRRYGWFESYLTCYYYGNRLKAVELSFW